MARFPRHILLAPALLMSAPSGATEIWRANIPARPVLDLRNYPRCQQEWAGLRASGRRIQIDSAQRCINALDEFNKYDLGRFPSRIKEYSRKLQIAFANFDKPPNKPIDRNSFREYVNDETACFKSIDRSGQIGDCYEPYYRYLDKYKSDNKALQSALIDLKYPR